MSLRVTCRCQAQLKVKEELAGRRVKCPKCGDVLTVPRGEPVPTAKALTVPPAGTTAPEESYDLAPQPQGAPTKPVCPSCQAELPPGAVLCVQCGFHVVHGKRLETARAVSDDASCVPETAVGKCVCPSCKFYKPVRAGVCVWCGFHVSFKAKVPLREIASSCGVKDLATARARVSAQRHAQKCPSCGHETQSPGDLCRECDASEQQVLDAQQRVVEEQQQEVARNAPYQEYRQQTIARLTRLWNELLQLAKDDAVKLRTALSPWPQQLVSCKPPKELLNIEGLSEGNRRTLQSLAEGAKRVADAMAADLASEAWPLCQPKAAQRATQRVAMLCRLAKSLGKDPKEPNRISVWLVTPPNAGSFDDYDGGATETIRRQFGAALATRPCEVMNVDQRPGDSVTAGRRCLIVEAQRWLSQTKQWSDGTLKATTKVEYVDDEPDPGQQPHFQKVLSLDRQFRASASADDMAQAWAKSVLGGLPAGFHDALAPTWGGIDLTCPNCGHSNLITDRAATRQHPCTRCGGDAISGEAESVREMARQLKKAERDGGGLRMLFSPTARRQAREAQQSIKDALAAEKSATSSQLKHPEAVAENQRKIKALGAAASEP